MPMSRPYIYQSSISKQQIPKFSQDTLVHFISKSLNTDGVLLSPILWYFQIFENWLLQTMNCCKLFLNMSWISFQIGKSCQFSINTDFLTNEKATIGSLSRPWDQRNLILKSIEKVKPDFLLSLMYIFNE